ncbi:polysaccharide deacetylase [Peptoniphilus equinus]|uniref:Polysaccharide deacetylase n=1 Tax=Peptoniphilus equinus TaxID=3016343 RepID=A0ABY7QV02_9FIRM|nr:polysaccharide deacetylase family protein [Peptoniphilus equinus]WBW50191.1 polysaccharide deacetylase [Peptoniphilus equinus]
MTETNERRQRLARRKKRQARMRRRRILFFALVALILFALISLISRVIHRMNTPDEPAPFNWFVDKAYRDQKGIVRTVKPTYSTFPDSLNSIYDDLEFMKKEIMPGENHLIQANSYAYDTKTIRQYIRGEAEYTADKKLVFLTFDDGPNTTITPQVLDILAKNDVHATFFVVGNRIKDQTTNVLRRTVYEGNAIATHSFSHDYETLYPEKTANAAKLKEESLLTQGRLQKIFGDDFKSNVMRYPGGHMSWQNTQSSDKALADAGIEWIDWNAIIGDASTKSSRPTTTEGFIETLDRSLNQNLHTDIAVVLMHDATNKQQSVDALQSIIDYFKSHNYEFGILK